MLVLSGWLKHNGRQDQDKWGKRNTGIGKFFGKRVVHGLEPGTMSGVRAVAETGALWQATGTGDAESREAGEDKEVRAVGSTGARLRRTEVAEVCWETRTGAVGIWSGAGAYRTRVSEEYCSEVVAESAGTRAGTKGVSRGASTGHGLGVGTKRGQNRGSYGHKILWAGGVRTLHGDANKCWGESVLNFELNPPPSTASTGRPAH